jgi:hypothetical protein
MKVELKESKFVTSLNTDVSVGSFALDTQPLKFENCRERFASTFSENGPNFFFKHNPGQSKNIVSFIRKTETILGNEFFSEFAETNRDTLVWVSPSNFWRQCPMRRSFFTILLRAGNSYNLDTDNYEQCLFEQDYVRPTKKAVIRFLYGFTTYIGPDIPSSGAVWVQGWKSIFESKTEQEIKKMLVSKVADREFTPQFFHKSLWL